jgi:uncharacterized protein (DUF736 family)
MYDNNNSLALFPNEYKTTPNHPDYKGAAEVDGKKFKAAAWSKVSKAGKPYLSVKLTPEDEVFAAAAPSAPARQSRRPVAKDEDDNIPF